MSYNSITKRCSQTHSVRFGRKIVIVDTPGIFDTNDSNEQTQKEIFKCVGITSPGPHAFILVIGLSRYTDEQKRTVEHFIKYFGEKIYKYFIILFTGKDYLDESQEFMDYIRNAPAELQVLIKKCGGRIIAFNNRLEGKQQDEQVDELLLMILDNIKRNDGECYTNEMYDEAEKQMKKREEEIKLAAKMERDKEYKEIEKKIALQYESRLAEETKKHAKTLHELEERMARKQVEDRDVYFLKEKIKELQEQVHFNQGNAKEEILQQINKLRKDLHIKEEKAEKEKRVIEDLQKKTEEDARQKEELIKKQNEEETKKKKEAEKKYLDTANNARNALRTEVEREEGFFTRAWNTATSWIPRIW